jgi:hypothetical protein
LQAKLSAWGVSLQYGPDIVLSALAPIVSVLISLYGLDTWMRTIRNNRVEDLIGAINDLKGSAGRCESSWRERHLELFWRDWREMWDAWSKFRRAYVIVLRYYPQLADALDPEAARQLINGVYPTAGHQPSDSEFRTFVERVHTKMDRLEAVLPRPRMWVFWT